MENSQLKDEFEQVNESSGTSPHRYGKEAFRKGKKAKCNKNILWLGGAIVALIIWKYCDSNSKKSSLLSMLDCKKSSCPTDLLKSSS